VKEPVRPRVGCAERKDPLEPACPDQIGAKQALVFCLSMIFAEPIGQRKQKPVSTFRDHALTEL
ncbi:hypothetical protein, partial [Mesorhizobium sp.]|uniref:hypothetical protein n=1 Tax=Mesorhizobium sp. TaxID=1871066 RepID=UPI0025E16D9B